METGKMKLALSAGALALSMALAGCGGSSSSGGPTTGGNGNGNGNNDSNTVQLPDGVTAASLVAGRFSIDAGEDVVIGSALFSCTDDDCVVSISDDGEVTKTGGMVGVRPALTGADGKLVAANCGTGTTLNDAETMCVLPTPQAKMGADTAQALKAAISRGGTGVRGHLVTTTYTAIGNEKTKPTIIGPEGSRIGLLKDETNVPALGNWKGSDSSGKDSSGTSAMLRVYSNKAAAGKTPNFSVAGDIGCAECLFMGITDGGEQSTTTAVVSETGAYDIIEGRASDEVESEDFPAVGAAVLIGTYEGAEQRTIEGKYDGAEGTFKCTGTTCTATRGSGGITFAGTGAVWTFTPKDGQRNDVEDTKYLEFGWWVHKDKSKAPTHADVFYDGSAASGPLDNTMLTAAALNGKTATYEGAAAGKFAIHNPGNSGDNESGHFTADAMLKATFDEGNSNVDSSMTGTIDNFRLNDGSANPGWSVNLEKANWVVDDSHFIESNGTVWSIGDNNKNGTPNGEWEAQLFRTGTATTGIPDTVGGAFRSRIGNTHEMVGAFGATHQPSE